MILNYKLPNILPVFPLSDFIFFPNTSIPLNIFEQKYIEMINDSLKKDRLIGLIQPKYKKNNFKSNNPDLYSIGCAGKITNYSTTDDNRIVLVLDGISRFKILKELPNEKLYRKLYLLDLDFSWNPFILFLRKTLFKKRFLFERL